MYRYGDYQGWKNYETWAVGLFISNDQGEYEYWREIIEEEGFTSEESEAGTYSDSVVKLAKMMKDNFEEALEDRKGSLNSDLFETLLQSAFDNVEWREIAENQLSE